MKYSYKLILALCIIGLFSGCTIEEDDTPADAIDQLTITGRIIDHNNQPVKNIPVVFYFYRGAYIVSCNRKKATSKTDENGIYKFTIFRKTDENNDGLEQYYYLYPDLDDKKYFTRATYFRDIDAFWTDRCHVVSDYILWEAQYVKVFANTKPEGAEYYDIECEFEKPVYNYGKYYSSRNYNINITPYTTNFQVPLHQDLKFTMKWDGKCNRTVFVKKDNLPEQIDLSYIPE